MATDLYLIPLKVNHFDGKPADLLGGQHLKSLSAESGPCVLLSAAFLISPVSESGPGNQGKSKLPKQSDVT